MNNPIHTEPQLKWTRLMAFFAFFHFVMYSYWHGTVPDNIALFDGFIIFCWAVGSNGRATIVDAVRAFAGRSK